MRDGWTEATLGEIADIRIGRTPPRNESRYWTSDLTRPFCTIADMGGPSIAPQREGVTEAAEVEGRAKRAPAGSLLMSFKLTIGRIGFAESDVFPNEAIAWLEPRSGSIDKRFLALWLSAIDVAADAGRAVMGATLNTASLKAIPVAFPRLAEQRRIVDLIGAVDEAVDSVHAVELRASAAWAAWAEECWEGATEDMRLGDLGRAITGSTPPTSNPYYWQPLEVPFFTPGDFDGRPLLIDAQRRVSRSGADVVRRLDALTVAQVCIGASYGKVAVLGVPGCSNQQVNALVGLDEIDAVAAMAMLASSGGQSRLRAVAGMTTLPIVKKSAWEAMRVRWPSRHERTLLHGVVLGCADVADACRRQAEAHERLRAALLSELLSGEHAIPASYDRLLGAVA